MDSIIDATEYSSSTVPALVLLGITCEYSNLCTNAECESHCWVCVSKQRPTKQIYCEGGLKSQLPLPVAHSFHPPDSDRPLLKSFHDKSTTPS